MKIVREIGDHFFMENSAEFSLKNGFSMEKNVREIDPWAKMNTILTLIPRYFRANFCHLNGAAIGTTSEAPASLRILW
jgi:hypothetical protein